MTQPRPRRTRRTASEDAESPRRTRSSPTYRECFRAPAPPLPTHRPHVEPADPVSRFAHQFLHPLPDESAVVQHLASVLSLVVSRRVAVRVDHKHGDYLIVDHAERVVHIVRVDVTGRPEQ